MGCTGGNRDCSTRLMAVATAALAMLMATPNAMAADWREQYPTINFGVDRKSVV